MTSDLLGVQNVFTTRIGGVSEGDFSSLNFGSDRGDEPEHVKENFTRLCSLFGVGINDTAVTKQVHGNVVRIVGKEDRHVCMGPVPYEADGIVTSEKGLPLLCFTADCVPVLIADKKKKSIAAVHCGWRSSVSDILNNAVTAMESLGTEREDILVAMGPAIGSCCFEVDSDVTDAIHDYIGDFDIEERGGKFYPDLRLANKIRLVQLGIPEENIDISDECTFCSHDRYWSHRYTTKNSLKRGSQTSVIML